MMGMVHRDYREGDEYKILQLFSEVFYREREIEKRKMSLKYWKWRFIENPFGKGIIKLLFDYNKLIGHYAVTPMEVKVADKIVNTVFSMTTMTHPKYRGRGIFPLLAEETYSEAARRGFKFVYGFPNQNSYKPITKKVNWKGFGNMEVWQKKLNSECASGYMENGDIKKIGKFDNSIDYLWKKVRQSYSVAVPRTKVFLNWRFVQNPEVDYIKYMYVDSKGEVSGYIVSKIYRLGNEIKGHVVDLLSVPDKKVVRTLLQCAYNYFIEQGITDISCWFPKNGFYADILRGEGFSLAKMERTFFGCRIFDRNDESLKVIEDISNWYLTMGDSDVF